MRRLRLATFNVSMEASNYLSRGAALASGRGLVAKHLRTGRHGQIRNIAEILQRVRPDVVLLNEFDYLDDGGQSVRDFLAKYLAVSQYGQPPLDYRHWYQGPVNTGVPSPFDIDGDGNASGTLGDAWGFGHYPGQYGMLVLSRFPIHHQAVRSFRCFPWHRMPDAQRPRRADGQAFYDDATWQGLRLSSKAHWDLPLDIDGQILHLLCAHPTPPVFDGPERRNAARNFDEIRLWADYVSPERGHYLVDDQGGMGALPRQRPFVILGDYNASPLEGRSRPGAIEQLLNHPGINADRLPQSDGGRQHSTDNPHGARHTADWRAQVDYVLPSRDGITPLDSGVFWPTPEQAEHRLIAHRRASSDHRLVWLDLALTPTLGAATPQ